MANVMIVDDAAFMRHMLRTIVKESGHEVVAEAANGLEAVKLARQYKPDLITMDITMPDMDGVAAVKKILADGPASRIIMCSAMGQHDFVLEAIKSGAKDFIVKPFDRQRVMAAIIKVLQ